MKFTWGHGITIGFTLFVVYILSFVYRSFNENIDLVAEDYYAQEVVFQDRIDETQNAKIYADLISATKLETEVVLEFPKEFQENDFEGEVHFFRPSDKSLDPKFPLRLDDSAQVTFPSQLFKEGRYEVKIHWSMEGRNFYLAKQVYL